VTASRVSRRREMKEDGMENIEPNEGAELVHRAARAWVYEAEAEFELVPVVLIALELGEPVELVTDHLGDAVQLDDLGMRAVPASVAKEFLAGRAEQAARIEDQGRRLLEAQAPTPVAVGVKAVEGLDAHESLMSAPGYTTVKEEFGRPSPTFLEDALAEGQRAEAEKRALVKKAQRALDGQGDEDR
jgi:hypothetical protein